MCTRGTDVHSRPLPSLVTRTIDPVSATPKLHPEMPRSARRNSARSCSRGEGGERRRRSLEDAIVGDLLLEELRDLVAVEVHRGGDDVARLVVRELDDPLAEVGLDDVTARRLERLVEVGLLGRHRLRLHDRARADALRDRSDVAVRLGAIARPEDMAPVRGHVVGELLEQLGQPRDHIGLDGPCRAPQAVGILERVEGGKAMLAESRRRSGEGAAQTNVGRRLGRALAERRADERVAASSVLGHGALPSSPDASTCAMWRVSIGLPS